jgi:hypothetical protein
VPIRTKVARDSRHDRTAGTTYVLEGLTQSGGVCEGSHAAPVDQIDHVEPSSGNQAPARAR